MPHGISHTRTICSVCIHLHVCGRLLLLDIMPQK
jgi:hypothetical protein